MLLLLMPLLLQLFKYYENLAHLNQCTLWR